MTSAVPPLMQHDDGSAPRPSAAERREADRERFLTLLATLRRLREIESGRRRAGLVQLHADCKYMLLAYDERGMRELGGIVATVADRPWSDSIRLYRDGIMRALERPATVRGHVNALMHAFGHVSDHLSDAERSHFLGHLTDLRNARSTPAAALAMLRGWVLQFDVPYLAAQSYFDPHGGRSMHHGYSHCRSRGYPRRLLAAALAGRARHRTARRDGPVPHGG